MEKTSFVGMFALTAGLVFFFTSSSFSMLSINLGTLFQGLGIIFIYVGIAFVLWNVLRSLNIFLEKLVKRT